MAKRFVEKGFGLTVIPETAVRHEREDGCLAKVNLQGFHKEASFYLLFHKG